MNLSILTKGEPSEFQPGIHFGMSREEYDAIPAFSQTALKKWMALSEIPSEFKFWLDNRDSEPQSEALLLGSALDCLLLEPDDFDDKFVVAPEGINRRTKEGKDAWQKIVDSGKTILTHDQSASVASMARALKSNESTRDVFHYCKKAVICAEIEGFPCKGEIDLFNPNTEHLPDLKTCRDVAPSAFAKSAADLGYDIQAEFYRALARANGIEKNVFDWVCVRNSEPWTVAVYTFSPLESDDDAYVADAAMRRIIDAMQSLARQIESGSFEDCADWRRIKWPSWHVANARKVAGEA